MPSPWLLLVPRDEAFVPPAGTALEVASILHARFVSSKPSENGAVPPPKATDETQTSFWLSPHERRVPIGRFLDGYTWFSLWVKEFPVPTDELDHTGVRYCRSCGTLVRTMAECDACGVEEDPGTWRMGPPQVIYTRAFEFGIVADGALDIWPAPADDAEAALRQYFGDVVPELERRLGTTFRFVRWMSEA